MNAIRGASDMKIAVGDEVRVHFHLPGSMKSFSEGMVKRVDVTTPQGRFFVVEVTHEVILDHEHRVRPSFEDYVLYECRSDSPGRAETLSTAQQEGVENDEPSPATGRSPVEVPDEITQKLSTNSLRFNWSVWRSADVGA
jgi:hypothetical protein